jgi:REP element-mobilizing transposase RayT
VPRSLRIEYHGALYHVTSNGIAELTLFVDDRDRLCFLGLLDEAIRRFGWECLAYCLLDTHFHLIIVTPSPNLASGMRWLKTRYAALYNKRHDRRGPVFDRRYYAGLVKRESHAAQALVYVAVNPVRAGVVDDPADWPWSSCSATAGLSECPAFLDAAGARILVTGGADDALRYRAIVRQEAVDIVAERAARA